MFSICLSSSSNFALTPISEAFQLILRKMADGAAGKNNVARLFGVLSCIGIAQGNDAFGNILQKSQVALISFFKFFGDDLLIHKVPGHITADPFQGCRYGGQRQGIFDRNIRIDKLFGVGQCRFDNRIVNDFFFIAGQGDNFPLAETLNQIIFCCIHALYSLFLSVCFLRLCHFGNSLVFQLSGNLKADFGAQIGNVDFFFCRFQLGNSGLYLVEGILRNGRRLAAAFHSFDFDHFDNQLFSTFGHNLCQLFRCEFTDRMQGFRGRMADTAAAKTINFSGNKQ
nr:MAG TPA: hypothetical protein [Caudoviricetes sp.]